MDLKLTISSPHLSVLACRTKVCCGVAPRLRLPSCGSASGLHLRPRPLTATRRFHACPFAGAALQTCACPSVAATWVYARLASLAAPFHVFTRPCLSPKAPTSRAWRWLSQPRQQVRRRRFLRPGQVQGLLPATISLVRACQRLRARLPRSRPWQRPAEGLGRHGTQVCCLM